jgi:hypothetical protein
MIALEKIMTWLRRVVCLLPVLFLFVLAASCDNFFPSENSIQSVTVTPTAVLLQAGVADTYTGLVSTALTVGGTSTVDTTASTTTWSVSPTSGVVDVVATGADAGHLTSTDTNGGDTATVKATDGGQSGSATVLTYTGTAPTSFTLTPTLPTGVTAATIQPNSQFPVVATGTLSAIANVVLTPYITWSLTSNTAGATIASNGEVTVPSTATINTVFTVQAQLYFGTAAVATIPTGIVTESLPFTVQ